MHKVLWYWRTRNNLRFCRLHQLAQGNAYLQFKIIQKLSEWFKGSFLSNEVQLWLYVFKLWKISLKQSTSDGAKCVQQVCLNDKIVWETEFDFPSDPYLSIFFDKQPIYMCGNDMRVLGGQIRNFQFFTQ